MKINIEKTGPNKWYLNIRVFKNGKELRRRESFEGTKSQAQERFMAISTELRYGKGSLKKNASTFGDLLDLYWEKRRPSSRKAIDQFNRMKRDLGDYDLATFTEQFEYFLKLYRNTLSARTLRQPSNGSVNRFLMMVKAVINLAVKLEVMEKNPLTSARFPLLKVVPRDRILTPQEILHFENVLVENAPHLLPMVRFALKVPCRKAELVNMRREDLDLFSSPPSIRVRNGTTKNGRGCWKPIPNDMLPYFKSIPSECPFLFFRIVKGEYRPLGDFKRAWYRCLDIAGIKNFRFHDTRHISASGLIDNGTPEQVVMLVAGWSTNMLKTYYHRDGKKALGLVRFSQGTGHLADTPTTQLSKIA